MFHQGWFWVDAGSTALEERIVGVTHHYGVVRTGPLHEGVAAIRHEPRRWAGVITQVASKARELEALRLYAPNVPVLALVNRPEPATLDALEGRGIAVANLPLDLRRVTAFVQRAFTAAFLPHEHVARVVQELAEREGLTSREVQIVAYCLANEPRLRVRKRLGITENTLKSQVRGLLRKCGERSVDALAKNILRAALLVGGTAAPSEPVAPWLPVAC